MKEEVGARTSSQSSKAQFRIHHDRLQSFEASARVVLVLGADAKRIKSPSRGKRFLSGAAGVQGPLARPEVVVARRTCY